MPAATVSPLRARCEVVPFAAGADVYVVNSCAVTDRADAESRQARFSHRHVFPYSRRTGTGAAKASDQLPPATIAWRAFAQRFVGTELDVLVESGRDRETGRPAGYSRNYVRVLVDGPAALVSTELRVHAVARRGDRPLAAGAPPPVCR
jgi:tRNA A37 methylthiotransferase MiaB